MLTDAQIKKAKPQAKPYKLTDAGGLHLYVPPTGRKFWRLRYEFGGKEKLLSIGEYPEVSLFDAREARGAAKRELRSGRDPAVAKKRGRLSRVDPAETFEAVARDWHTRQAPAWSERHAYDVLHELERDVFPELGARPIREIDATEVIGALRDIEDRGARETARRARQRMSAVFVYAIAAGKASSDPAAIVQKAMAPVVKGKQPAITKLEEAREVLRRAEAIPAHPVTRLALRLLALTALRPGTLITTPRAELAEIDDKDPVWQVPAARMKLRKHLKDNETRDHLVPLSWQAMEVVEALRQFNVRSPFVFPSVRNAFKPLSANALGYMLNRAGYHHRHVPHGWRSTFSTVLNELFPAEGDIIDFMLAHVPKDKVEAAYNRALYLPRRKELAQIWADLIMVNQVSIDELLGGARRSVLPRWTARIAVSR